MISNLIATLILPLVKSTFVADVLSNPHVSEETMCYDHFEITRNTIIRTEESRAVGAKYLNETDLPSGDDCLLLCCKVAHCNVAVYEEKGSRGCYLFDCGSPDDFKCTFTPLNMYTSGVMKKSREGYEQDIKDSQGKHAEDLSKLRSGKKPDPASTMENDFKVITAQMLNFSARIQLNALPFIMFVMASRNVLMDQMKVQTNNAAQWTLENQLKEKGTAKGEPLVVAEKVKQLRVNLQMRCKISLNSHLCTVLQLHPRSPIEQVWALMIMFHNDLAGCFFVYFSLHAAKGSIFNHKDNQLLTGNRHMPSVNQGNGQRTNYPAPGQWYNGQGPSAWAPYQDESLNSRPQQASFPQYGAQGIQYGGQEYDGETPWHHGNPPLPAYPPPANYPQTSGGGGINTMDRGYQPQLVPPPAPQLHSMENMMPQKSSFTNTPQSGLATTVENHVKNENPAGSQIEGSPAPAHKSIHQLELELAMLDDEESAESLDPGGAVLALTLGLCVTALLAVLIVCRLRNPRRLLRRSGRPPLEHDSDYLVNGLYL
ncbi:unnamed protein product [Darwinula stevensoni]|uniref:MANSC domain-containing protein n=1 Tax=Darwinula stevensoni TaxID=69355 RepID=A0A7R9FQ43_9CRUS|nr:unnamed protein product [Darwinula stevensoni]CAG0898799.1 unnamed protein product [Darwinula stevensoni]